MTHIIGDGSSYDADIQIVESFVRAKNNPDDIIAQTAVFTYYISQLYNYWGYFTEHLDEYKGRGRGDYFWNINTIEEINSPKLLITQRDYNKQFIIENLPRYQEKFINLVNETQDKFQNTGKLNIQDILYLFKYVGSLMCLQPQAESVNIAEGKGITSFILPNEVGFFGFNTYLYAYVSGIFLVGIPRHDEVFDDIKSCPLGFLGHDFNHSRTIQSRVIKSLPEIYLNIIQSTLPKIMKELLVLVLWIQLHEFYIDAFVKLDPQGYYIEISRENEIVRNVRTNLSSEFDKFSSILENSESLSMISEIFGIKAEDYIGENYELTMLFGYAYIAKYIVPAVQKY